MASSRSSDGSLQGDNMAGTYQQLTMIPKEVEVTSVMKEEDAGTDNSASPMGISMLHDYAMDHLFSFLPMADLKNCRLVNRYWNCASNRAIQKRDYVFIFPKDRYSPHREVYGIADIPRLCQLVSTSFQFPWTKFSVYDWGMNSTEKKQQLADLLRVISPFATELEVSDLQSLDNLEYPNLRKLELAHASVNTARRAQKSLLRLVERASKLNDIAISGSRNTPLFMELLETPTCRKISRLSLSRWIEEKHLIRLSEMGLQLKYLFLTFELAVITADSLRAVLQSQSNCLEHLELTCDDEYFPDEDEELDPRQLLGMECPRMEKLKEFRVHSINLYSRISYKDMFPVLKKLKLSLYDDAYPVDSFLNDDVEPVETVEYLSVGYWPQHPERILQAARQFPKVRSISLIVNRNMLNVLGHAMPQLEEMELLFGTDIDLDVILTGLSEEEVKTLKDLPVNQLDVLERSKQPVHFLKNLKTLRLTSLVFRIEQRSLTDFGCRFALLKMQHLLLLETKGISKFIHVSDQVMERMRKKFALIYD